MIAHKSVDWVLTIVSWASAIDWLSFRTSVPVNAVVLALPVLHILLPAGWPGRRVVLLAVISVVTTKPEPLPAACFSYHVLDVGQGLAVVVRTRDHALLFDTGPAFQSGSNTAELVVLPFLRYAGIGRLDTVIVSHGDLDHAGGIRNIIMSTKVGKVMTGEVIPALGNAQIACRAGQRWRWNGVNFRVLHPRESSPWQGNNSSCVLEIAAGTNRLLLTGDIETPVELLLQYRQIFRPSLAVVVPHHGSGTSSSASLVDVTSPAIAIVSAGRRNRWGFPRQDVVARWQFAGAQVISTAVAGAVSQQLCPDRVPEVPATARTARWKYWHEHQQDQL
jgi:competence protein ComEC